MSFSDDELGYDDNLEHFDAHGAAALPPATGAGFVENAGARISFTCYGSGLPVILLHGGMGNSKNWGYQADTLIGAGYRTVLIDSRGHGRSTRNDRPFTYELMASDVWAVMDELHIEKAALVGWSDGACVAMMMARERPQRVASVFYFGCNMDPNGTREIEFPNPVLDLCMSRHTKDYADLSATPGEFKILFEAVGLMQRTQPNWSLDDLAEVDVPVLVVHSEQDEFIRAEHAEYLARNISGAELVVLPEVSHFAPLQRPALFNRVLLNFLNRIYAAGDQGRGSR